VALLLCVVSAAAAAAGGVVISGETIAKVRGAASVGLLACPPAGSCVSEGEVGDHATTVLSVSRTGRVGHITRVPNANGAFGLACPSANFCLALAQADSPATSAVVIPIRSGVPGAVEFVADSYLASISCGSRRSCWAFGGNPRRYVGRIVHIVSGRIVHQYTVPGTMVGGGSCVSASRCIELGVSPGSRLKVLTLDSGRVTHTTRWTAPAPYQADGVACQSATDCVVISSASDPRTGSGLGGALATVTDGRLGPLQRIKGTIAMYSLTCSPTACFAIGGRRGHEVVVPIVNGSVGEPIGVKLGLSVQVCGKQSCWGFSVGKMSRFTYSVS
jgi:hypothetical protein